MTKPKRVTFKVIKKLFSDQNFEIQKGSASEYRINKTESDIIHAVMYDGTLTKFYDEVIQIGIDSFLQNYTKKTYRVEKANLEAIETVDNTPKATLDGIDMTKASADVMDDSKRHQDIAYHHDIDWDKKLPTQHDGYYFPDFTKSIVTRIKMGRNIYFTGESGTGKTELFESLTEHFGHKGVSINFSVGITESHLVGKYIVKDGQTIFVYGLLPLAMKNGWWLNFDELDYAQPEHLAILNGVLTGKPLIITQNENEEVIPHPNFRLFATSNTKGRGDDTQGYGGTNFLNLAFLDRWSIFEIEFTKHEPKLIQSLIQDKTLAKQLTDFFKILRKSSKDGEIINSVFSTRRLKQICEVLQSGETLTDSLKYELISRYDDHEQELIAEWAQDVWDKGHYLNGKWKLGDHHIVVATPETVKTQSETKRHPGAMAGLESPLGV